MDTINNSPLPWAVDVRTARDVVDAHGQRVLTTGTYELAKFTAKACSMHDNLVKELGLAFVFAKNSLSEESVERIETLLRTARWD